MRRRVRRRLRRRMLLMDCRRPGLLVDHTVANLLTRDEVRRIAANIAQLPELLGAQPKPDANPLIHRLA
jgi:hypothetical protein